MVALAAAAVTLFYLAAIPVHIAVHLHIGSDFRFGFGISIFEPRFAMDRALRPKASPKPPKLPKTLDKTDALRAARSALRHLKIDRLSLDGVFGADDAAVTALVCGGVSSLSCAMQCAVGRGVRMNLRPDFSANRLRIELTGMISVRAGHIMTAALLGAFQYASRRFKAWTSIPSKAL